MRHDAQRDHDNMHDDEEQENRQHDEHRFPDAAQIEKNQREDQQYFNGKLVSRQRRRQKTEHCVGAAGDRNGDRQHVVDHQRRPRHQARPRAEQLGGHQIAAAAGREQLDDLRIAGGNDEDRHGRQNRQQQSQMINAAPAPDTLPPDHRPRNSSRRRPVQPRLEKRLGRFDERLLDRADPWLFQAAILLTIFCSGVPSFLLKILFANHLVIVLSPGHYGKRGRISEVAAIISFRPNRRTTFKYRRHRCKRRRIPDRVCCTR